MKFRSKFEYSGADNYPGFYLTSTNSYHQRDAESSKRKLKEMVALEYAKMSKVEKAILLMAVDKL